ncbi:CBS domain-containing protein [Caballeronia calidae]|uniref:CBS domain-containing protein n=1 Tax=Caballeronia calidae TaxID=1777139 RepID=A0A158E5V9_9BURK|nr:CBS domain-containing protein [Caballeronia calidae]SAL02194.1 CBS domain-containing protein [Caballeronia calidae]
MQARDVMTTSVISVTPETTVRELAVLLMQHRISAAPVVDQDKHVIGVVSEGDLLHRDEIDTERKTRHSWWLGVLSDNGAADYIKSHARTVGEIMTRDPICVDETVSLADIASILESHHIKRVPVLRDGRLVGIVSRANLVQALATALLEKHAPSASSNDAEIRAMLMGELAGRGWAFPGRNIVVRDGVVHLWGVVWSSDQLDAMRIAAESIPGVKSVEDHTIPYPVMPGL